MNIFKVLKGKFTKPYPKGELVGIVPEKIQGLIASMKRARELTEKYGVSVLFIEELDK